MIYHINIVFNNKYFNLNQIILWNKKQYQKWSYNYLVNKEVTLKNYPLLQRKKLKHFIISLGQNHRRLQIIFMN